MDQIFGNSIRHVVIILFIGVNLPGCDGIKAPGTENGNHAYRTWRTYRGDDGINAYSTLKQINQTNAGQLTVAWTYRSGDHRTNSMIECNPIIVDSVLYATSPKLKVFALNAATGEELWIFDPFDKNSKQGGINRGVTYWEKGRPNTGTQLFGGAVVTAGGVLFIGASKDEKFRVFNKENGQMLWEYQLPAGGYATPATYEINGKQYVVIAAGGGGFQSTKSGDYYIAFSLP